MSNIEGEGDMQVSLNTVSTCTLRSDCTSIY